MVCVMKFELARQLFCLFSALISWDNSDEGHWTIRIIKAPGNQLASLSAYKLAVNWYFWTMVLGNTLESPLNSMEIKSANCKGNQPWIFTGRTDAEAKAPILGPPGAKNWLIGKDPDAGRDWGQEEKGVTVGWHHWLNGHEFEQAPGDSERQGTLECRNPWGRKESDMT